MVRVLRTEMLKYSKSKVLLIMPLAGLITAFSSFFHYLVYWKEPIVPWNMLFMDMERSLNLLAPALFALLVGFIYTREYQENTINILFTYPISRVKVMLCKLLITIPIIFTTVFFSFLTVFLLGLFLNHDVLTVEVILNHIKISLLIVFMHFALMPIAIVISITCKNIVAPAVLGISSLIMFLAFLNSKFNVYYPWVVPLLIADKMANRKLEYLVENYSYAWITLLIAFILPFIFALIYFQKSDVR